MEDWQHSGNLVVWRKLDKIPLPGKDRKWETSVTLPSSSDNSYQTKITFGTWNVRKLINCGQVGNLKQKISKLNVNILCVYETMNDQIPDSNNTQDGNGLGEAQEEKLKNKSTI